jgi:hypothetical protein
MRWRKEKGEMKKGRDRYRIEWRRRYVINVGR